MMPETHTTQDDPLPLAQHGEGETEEKDDVPKGERREDTGTTTVPDPVVARGDGENAAPDG